ncbi:hypothetical protein ACTWP4_16590 [Gracilibacillus sp. D59]|uniref:hypothetical protein n=1 Tax=Gracilibacillus sp. D59 TaxID=3457434 RepID=UPI003FCE2BBA
MKKVIVFLITIVLTGCLSNVEQGELYLSEQVGIDGERDIDVITDQEVLNEVWEKVEFQKSVPTINDGEAFIIAYTMENSCAKSIDHTTITEVEIFHIETKKRGTNCNDIGIERTFVFEIDKETFTKLESIEWEEEPFTIH